MIEFNTEVLEVIQRTKDVKSFRFRSKEDADFTAGQWFFLTIKIGEEEQTKPFSFSNSPTEKGYLEFTKRLTQSDFSKTLDKLVPGDVAKIKMSYGNFSLEAGGKKILILSGGIGITPVRSMCKYATDTGLDVDIALLYGNAAEDEIVFRDDFDAMQKENSFLKVVHTLACPVDGWKGCCGFIDKNMIFREFPDCDERVYYVCGPPAMVNCLTPVLKEGMGVSDDRIILERFMGY
ncbi:MAG: FAD-binding oxidoreductase [Candidatus Tantalella remota]|nr:FAD-binding oxidoreductase [Candidatus Tantalella remota]